MLRPTIDLAEWGGSHGYAKTKQVDLVFRSATLCSVQQFSDSTKEYCMELRESQVVRTI